MKLAILEWSATFLTIIGAVLTALNMYPENVIAFNLGSIIWVAWAWRLKIHSILAVNLILLGIYFFGLVRAI